jgi:hypothetical protein
LLASYPEFESHSLRHNLIDQRLPTSITVPNHVAAKARAVRWEVLAVERRLQSH